MNASASNLRRKRSSAGSTFLRWLLALFFLVTLGWFIYVYQQIADVADQDDAQPADAIAVFGAAEYSGRPSPTFHYRLDHAVDLYRKQIAPLVITLGGGSEKDSGNTEGAVGRDYLLANGIPFGNIVSDATHLFRIRELCKDAGLDVYTSPRATIGHISSYDLFMRYFHEILSYTANRLGLNISWLRRWLEGKEDF